MSPLEAALLVAALALPLHGLVLWQLTRLDDPAYLRAHGVVVVRQSALDGHAEAVGSYEGWPIWGSVTFKGMLYCFDRVRRPQDREKTGPGELWLEPGLVYVAA